MAKYNQKRILTLLMFICLSLPSCAVIIDEFIFPNQCSCKVIGSGYVLDGEGNTVWKDDAVHWSGSVLKKEKVEELKRQCREQAAQYPSARCECED